MEKSNAIHLESAPPVKDMEVVHGEYVPDPDTGEKVYVAGKTDYSGAAAKTDPAEIALVKKLDRWIMPILWLMYYLNYVSIDPSLPTRPAR